MDAPHEAKIRDPNYLNWVKAGLALMYTKEGIQTFIDDETKEFHASVLKKFGQHPQNCSQCTIKNLLPHEASACPGRNHICICSKDVKNRRDCPNNTCGTLFSAIMSSHRFKGPAWKNSLISQWVTDHWEIAKNFLPITGGYKNIKSASDTDLSGLANIGINLENITKRHSFTRVNSDAAPDDFCQCRTARNEILHSASQSLTDDELRDYLDIMRATLQCTLALRRDHTAKQSLIKLLQLETSSFEITDKNITEIKLMAISAIQNEGRKQAEALTDEGENQKQIVNTEGADQVDAIKVVGEKQKQSVVQTGKRTLDCIETEGDRERKRIRTEGEDVKGNAIEAIESEGKKNVDEVKREGENQIQKIKQAATTQADARYQEEKNNRQSMNRSKSDPDDCRRKDSEFSGLQMLTKSKSLDNSCLPGSSHSDATLTDFFPPYEEDDMEDEEISLREYQTELGEPALAGQNVIIVAPTGSGKTRVACRIIQEHIRKMKGRGIARVIFLVNQVALANQQGEACRTLLPKYTSKVISGESQRSKHEYLKDFVDKRDILIVTAGVLRDALVNKEIEGIHIFSLMIFDECHNTHSNAAFNQIMGTYLAQKSEEGASQVALPQIVGLTASMGVGKARNVDKAVEHIKKLMANLDADTISTVKNNMSELRSFISLPEEETVEVPKRKNDLFGESVTRLMNKIETRMAEAQVVRDLPEFSKFEVHLKAPASKGNAQYTQWVSKLWKEIAKLRREAARLFLNPCKSHLQIYNDALIIYNDSRTKDALAYLDGEMKCWSENLIMSDDEKTLSEEYEVLKKTNFDPCSMNPKLERLRSMIIKAYQGEDLDSRGIVFVKTRDLAKAIVSWMKEDGELKDLNPIPFLGQNSNGMTKGEQDNALKYFRGGKHKLIVATSVAEEGLDISQCNLVIRYDHVTNEIAMVQSRGRGRAKNSKYMVLAQERTGVAEKEELNMIREVMMTQAIIKLQEEIIKSPNKVRKEIKEYQEEANLDRQLKSLGSKKRMFKLGDFELRCNKCNNFICMSSDVKKIENAHHVVLHETLENRVKFVPDQSSEPIDNDDNCKILCIECGETLGGICIHRQLHWYVLKIEKFLIVDSHGKTTICKKWSTVPFFVSPLSTSDFKDILKKMKEKEG